MDDDREFSVNIAMGNEAFEDAGGREVARILRDIAAKLERGEDQGACMDANGNRVGEWAIWN